MNDDQITNPHRFRRKMDRDPNGADTGKRVVLGHAL
jgi:hypothetical protein